MLFRSPTYRKEKSEARLARKRDIQQVLYQEAEHRAIEVFSTAVAAHDNTYMYPAANIEILCKSIPVREGIYRKSTIAYNSQGITNYMQQKYK